MGITDGNIFEAMRLVLPEHRELMEQAKRKSNQVEKPILSEDELIEIHYSLSEAIENQTEVEVTIYHENSCQVLRGIPQVSNEVLHLNTPTGVTKVPFELLLKLCLSK